MGAGNVKRRVWVTISGLAVATALAGCERELILEGERFPVRADLEASIPVEGQPAPVAPPDRPENRAEPISLPAAQANANWGHRGGAANHAQPHGALSAAPQRVWTVNLTAGNSRKNRVSAAPVVAEGRVFTLDAASVVQATGTNGAVLWQADLTAEFDRGGGVSGGGLAAAGGRVYATTSYGELVALDAANGGVVWRQRLDSPVTGAPAVEGNTVYVAGRDGSGWAVAADTGRVRWTVPGAVGRAGRGGAFGRRQPHPVPLCERVDHGGAEGVGSAGLAGAGHGPARRARFRRADGYHGRCGDPWRRDLCGHGGGADGGNRHVFGRTPVDGRGRGAEPAAGGGRVRLPCE